MHIFFIIFNATNLNIPTMKEAANYAKIDRVGTCSLGADFQQVSLDPKFFKFSHYCYGTSVI